MKQRYKKKCLIAKRDSWRRFIETTPNESRMAVLNKIVQGKSAAKLNTLVDGDGNRTEPGAETLRLLAATHFPAATEGIPHQQYGGDAGVILEEVREKFQDWVSPARTRRALKQFKISKAPGPDNIRPVIFRYLPRQRLNISRISIGGVWHYITHRSHGGKARLSSSQSRARPRTSNQNPSALSRYLTTF